MVRPLIVANWKMNGSLEALNRFFKDLKVCKSVDAEVVVLPPAVYIRDCIIAVGNQAFSIGIQNVWIKEAGAYTGEISARMAKDIGASWVMVGHSERRQIQNETDELVKLKLDYSLESGLNIVLCVGETLEERLSGKAKRVVSEQLRRALMSNLNKNQCEVVVAYEPLWAIGSGRSASPKDVQEMHALIRSVLTKTKGMSGMNLRILYGGSVTSANAADFIKQQDVNGLLVGGASLEAESFSSIINALG